MADVKVAALERDGLQEVTWDACDELLGGALVASPGDAHGRGIALSVTRSGEAVDLTGAHAYLVWRHHETRRRGCVPFSADDASQGRFSVFYPAAMASEEGTVEAQVMLSWGARALSSRTFSIRVERVLAGDGGEEDGFSMFVEAIKRLEGMALDAVDAAGAAADAAQGAADRLLAAKEAGEFAGAPGRDGVDGSDGAPGRDGRDGKDGAPGEKGEKGDPGEPGPRGEAFTFADFTAEQLASLKGPKGDPGADGAGGATGARGEVGPQGPRGETGPTGPQGERGPAGPQGEKGDPGPKGDPGSSGGRVLAYDGVLNTATESASFISDTDGYAAGDLVVDSARNLSVVIGIKDYYSGRFMVSARILGSLRNAGIVTCKGLDVDPGVTTTETVHAYGYFIQKGDLVLSTDTGVLGQVARLSTSYVEDTYVYVKGLARLGAGGLSAYATKEYVDGKLAEIQSLEEVSF